MDFSVEEVLLWIMVFFRVFNWYFRKQRLKLKYLNNGFISYKPTAFFLHKTLIDRLESCG